MPELSARWPAGHETRRQAAVNGRVLWQSDVATVILGDAREVLAELATESVDLVVADPPYGVEWQSNLRAERFAMLDEDGADQRGGASPPACAKGQS